jgi:DNA polymerase-3 subunit delta'
MPRLDDIAGQEQALQVLRRAVAAGKVAHAYLFTGPEGVGKASCALALAGALNCERAPGRGCNECPSCHKVEQGLHPDLLHLEPDGTFIKIDQVRTMEQHLSFAPHEGRFRLVLIDGADKLNLNAANALLKSVEEPRPRTLFVLVAAAGHLVAPTLVSRCQRIRFLPLAPATIEQVLGGLGLESDAAEIRAAAALAEGSAKRALRLLEGEQMAFIRSTVAGLLGAAGGRDAVPVFEVAAEAGRDRQLLLETLDVLTVWLRDILLCREGLDAQRVVNTDRIEALREEANRRSRATIIRQVRAVDEARAALRGNVHPTLVLENLCLEMRQVTAS